MPHFYPISPATIKVHKVFVDTKTKLLTGGDFMLQHTKIKYHYEFPNLPITDSDIQSLNEEIGDILWTAESYILEFSHYEMDLPEIFISDDVVTKTYGKYDYKTILKETRKFYEAFPYSYFNGILEELVHTVKHFQENTSCKTIKEFIDHIEANLDHAEMLEERTGIEKIISILKNLKRTTPLLGAYYHQNNKITLYINTIVDYFAKAPTGDLATKIKTGLEIVLAHEVFHAIQYYLIGTDYAEGRKFWTHPICDEDYRNSVLEGLARWFEYRWCEDSQDDNIIYQWHKEQVEEELNTYHYPGWPYAAAKVFIKNGKHLTDEPLLVLDTLLESILMRNRHCWRNAYDVLELLDYRHKRLQQNDSANHDDSNPKMIFLC